MSAARPCEICNTYGSDVEGTMRMSYGVRALCHPCKDAIVEGVLA